MNADSARTRAWREANPEKYRAQIDAQLQRRRGTWRKSMLMLRYGMTVQQFDTLLEEQGGRCAICRTDEPGGRGTWHVDHNHETGSIRGLLCWRCNQGLGYFRDSPYSLTAAVAYLSNPPRFEGHPIAEHIGKEL